MRGDKIGFLFPAFAMKYRLFAVECLPGYQECLDSLLKIAAAIVPIEPEKFKIASSSRAVSDSEDDFQKHYVCYINSCAISEFLKQHGVVSMSLDTAWGCLLPCITVGPSPSNMDCS